MTVLDAPLGPQRPALSSSELDTLSSLNLRKRPHMQGSGQGESGDSNGVRESEGPEAGLRTQSAEEPPQAKKPRTAVRAERPPARSRRKSRWKLKFHHQALPPEYLKHYKQQEKKRRQSETKAAPVKSKSRKIVGKNISEPGVSLQPSEFGERRQVGQGDTGSGQATDRLQSGSEGGIDTISQLSIGLDISQNKAFLENLLTNQIEINRVQHKEGGAAGLRAPCGKPKACKPEERQPKRHSIPPSGKIMNYSDLPYMGEITLDGIKPRRGRKPKKADICHLIYKNYGQIFPGTPSASPEAAEVKKPRKWTARSKPIVHSSLGGKLSGPPLERQVESPLPSVSGLLNHSEVQNRIINSLLERRLTQELRFKSEHGGHRGASEEPLNLCIRDLQSLKIKLSRKHGNYYEAKHKEDTVEVKTEPEDEVKREEESGGSASDGDTSEDEDDLAPFNLVTTELRESSDEDSFLNFNDQITLTKVRSPGDRLFGAPHDLGVKTERGDSPPQSPHPVVPWSAAGMFLPPSPMMYYERLPGDLGPAPLAFPPPDRRPKVKCRGDPSRSQAKRTAPKMDASSAQVIAKRKRSAIFIPPVPAENTANPTTEVSICKFKFTGGAKPSLQEKKMLSVDSGGNFRYYSGTGDKSMRGYEYFPRESLQQCQENTGCSPSGVFLTASALGSGEKIPEDVGHSGFFDTDFPLHLSQKPSEVPRGAKASRKPDRYQTLRGHLDPEAGLEDERNSSENSGEGFDLQKRFLEQMKAEEEVTKRRRCRKTRKSLAREKLEQTFKEKGFLIQTQQLESAEGATYCKFRQLRKFTRYLFRSWKDYLPGNVRDLSVDAGVEQGDLQLPPLPPLPPLPGLPGLTPLLDLPAVKLEDKPFC